MDLLKVFKDCLIAESQAIKDNAEKFGNEIIEVIETMLHCKGKVVVTGVGKSGHIGQKIAATLASTGTPAFFMHATEGVHGDLGMISKNDVVLLISNSGNTEELTNLFPSLNRIGCKKIVITSNENAYLTQKCDNKIIYAYDKEADHLSLAPTVSSTLNLAIGDALAVTLSKLKKFSNDEFHLYHPGGTLGKKLEKKE